MQDAHSKPQLELAHHVRACACESCVVLLDLRRNRYLAISKPEALPLSKLIKGWPAFDAQPHNTDTPLPSHKTVQQLVALELLIRPASEAAPEQAPETALPTALQELDHDGTTARISARRTFAFLTSSASASWCLRHRSLWAIVCARISRKHRLRGPGAESIEAIQSACAAYAALRPFFFSTQQQCLHDSLSLLGFLATEGLSAQWVIGVKSNPFAAHSWVQRGDMVLNDQHERVRQFCPILVV